MTLDPKQQEVLNNLLLEAVKNNDVAHVRLYAGKGADVNASLNFTDQWGYTYQNPLYHFMPAYNFSTDISDFLISRGVDVDVRDYKGNTRLMLAVKDHDLPLSKYLISRGANPLSKNNSEEIVLDQARLMSLSYTVRQEIIDALVDAIDSPVSKADLPPRGTESREISPVETTHDVKTLKPLEFAPRKKGGGLNL